MGSRRGSRGPGRPSPRTKVSPGTHQAAVSAPERHPQHRVPTQQRSTEIKTGTTWQTPVQPVSSDNSWYPNWSNSHGVTASTGSALQHHVPPGSRVRRGRVPVLDTSGHVTQTQPREERGSMRGQAPHSSGTRVHGHRTGRDRELTLQPGRSTCRGGRAAAASEQLRARHHSRTVVIPEPPKQGAGDQLLTPPDLPRGPSSLPNHVDDQHPLLRHVQEGQGTGLSHSRGPSAKLVSSPSLPVACSIFSCQWRGWGGCPG